MRTLRTLSAVVAVVALQRVHRSQARLDLRPGPFADTLPERGAERLRAAFERLRQRGGEQGRASPSASASAQASAPAGGGIVLEPEAEDIAFNTTTLAAPADQRFQIDFKNNDPGIPHNVEVKDASGASPLKGDIITRSRRRDGVRRPRSPPVSTCSSCIVHPTMTDAYGWVIPVGGTARLHRRVRSLGGGARAARRGR